MVNQVCVHGLRAELALPGNWQSVKSTSFETPPQRRRLLRTNGSINCFEMQISLHPEEPASSQRASRRARALADKNYRATPQGGVVHWPNRLCPAILKIVLSEAVLVRVIVIEVLDITGSSTITSTRTSTMN